WSAPGPLAMRVYAAGAMALTLMPSAAPSVAMLRVRPTIPPLAVAYAELFGSPKIPAEVVMTMRPYPCSTMCGQPARAVAKEPPTCTAMCAARFDASEAAKAAHRTMPALLVRMSTRPTCATAVSTSACAPSTTETSLVSATATPPAATTSAATAEDG